MPSSRALVTDNLDAQFRALRQKPNGDSWNRMNRGALAVDPDTLPRKVRAQMASAGPTVDTLMGRMYNPYIQRIAIEEPRSWQERVRWKRRFFQTDPLVHSAISLHSEFPISNFHIQHEDSEIREFFEDQIDENGLMEFAVDMGFEYWLTGELTAFGFVDNVSNPSAWDGFILLDPLYVEPIGSQFIKGKRKEKLVLRMNDAVKTVVNNPTDPNYKDIFDKLPADIVEAARTGQGILLSDLQASRIKQPGGYFLKRGISPVDTCFRYLMLKDKMFGANYSIADRFITPTELWTAGNDETPADDAELQSLKEAVASTWGDINKAIFFNHTAQCNLVGGNEKIMPIWTEIEQIDKALYIGLMINEAMLLGEGPSYATSVVGYDVLIERWLSYRRKIERWFRERVFAPMCRIHRMYVPENKIKSCRYRAEAGMSRPFWIPDVRWERQHLRDESARLDLLVKLAAQNLVPMEYIYDLLEMDAETIEDMVDKEIIKRAKRLKEREERLQKLGLQMPPAPLAEGEAGPGGAGGGMIPDLGGGIGDVGGGEEFPEMGIGEEGAPGEEAPPGSQSAAAPFNSRALPGGPGTPLPNVGKIPQPKAPLR